MISNNYDSKNSMIRYGVISILMTLVVVAVIAKAFVIATVEKDYWKEVQSRVQVDDKVIPATRGSILSEGGQQLSCNLPEYRVYMDFVALRESKNDTLWWDENGNATLQLDTLCRALHGLFPERTADQYLRYMHEGYTKETQRGVGSRAWPVVNKRIDYTTYTKLKALTLFKKRAGISGFYENKLMTRNRPYGSLALSVIGTTYKEDIEFANGVKKEHGTPKSGLELTFDTLLRGKPGIIHRRKVLNSWVTFNDTLPTDGSDLVTTIDVGMQDLAERSLMKELKHQNSKKGVAIVMDVKSGDIKAMVSLDRDETGFYHESEFNHAISDLPEPGSVFKTASFMVAIEDGVIRDTANTWVDTQGGIIDMHKAKMRDHNWHKGGYGRINVSRILQVSSNIGVSKIIDDNYGSQPEKFVDGIYRTGLATDLKLPFPGYRAPLIRRPYRNDKGKLVGSRYPNGTRTYNWAKTTLPWMSIGYETNVPPISVLTFYNAIANNGRMVKPRFITRAEKDGQVIREFPTEVIKEHMASESTVKTVQGLLRQVVEYGLAKNVDVKGCHVAGKTGTALIAQNGGYKNGMPSYWLSFAGYFPYENPEYTCIVCIEYTGPYPSGGRMSGSVFHDIAEGIYARKIKYAVTSARDSLSVFVPEVKSGNILAADYVLSHLNLSSTGGWNGMHANGKPIWGSASSSSKEVQLTRKPVMDQGYMPNVEGMGARDAVFMLESRGVKVALNGRGRVTKQSKLPGQKIHKGEKVVLELSPSK